MVATKKKVIPESNWSDEIVTIRLNDIYGSSYPGQVGSLSYCERQEKGNVWRYDRFFSCRDGFQAYSGRNTKILFVCENAHAGKIVAKCIKQVETKLDLPFRTIVGMTSNNRVIWIKTNRWWSENKIRKSFFTAMLRSALNYDDKLDLITNLTNYVYFSRTPYATKRFLEGYTTPNVRARYGTLGWYNTFYTGNHIPKKYFPKNANTVNGPSVKRPVTESIVDQVLVKR